MIKTKRLILREWQEQDLKPFAKLNACAQVCEFLPRPLVESESDQLARKIIAHFKKHKFGLFAVERIDSGEFIGFTSLAIPSFEASFMPAVEIGWRLDSAHWGNGFATEAALAVVDYAFNNLNLEEILSFTTVENFKSRKVMEKIGMVRDEKGDFEHPSLEAGHALRSHVLYRLRKNVKVSYSSL